jgi:hypothetical protein
MVRVGAGAASGPDESRAVRLALAERVAPVYACQDACAAVIVGGSVARGWSDERSDVELGIFWRDVPPASERRRLALRVGGRKVDIYPSDRDPGLANDDYTLDHVKIDVVHASVPTMDTVLDDVAIRYDRMLWKHEVTSTLLSAIPLMGEEILASWRRRAVYSRELARVMIREHLVFGPRAYLETLAQRGDFLLLRTLLGRIERQLLGILLALNQIFTPSWIGKWTPRTVALLSCAPPDFLERARWVWSLPDSAAIDAVHALVDETLVLVEGHYPEVDIGPARARIAARSTDW